MIEEWRPVVGFENTHAVSNLGIVKSLRWEQKHSSGGKPFIKKERIIKNRIGVAFNGYSNVILLGECLFLHRVIAMAFIPNPENKPFVNHKNGIKTDNRVENLEWVTRSENAIHAFATGLRSNKGQKHPQHKFTDDDVLKIRKRYKSGESSWKIYKDLGGSYTNIKDIIAKRTWSHI